MRTFLVGAAIGAIITGIIIDRPVKAEIYMCEPRDAVEACKYIGCRAEYEIEGYLPGRKP